jgi:hypothetical protein
MLRQVVEVMTAFREGRHGGSVRDLRLRGRTVFDVHTRLSRLGFTDALRLVVSERGSRGQPRWLRQDGTSALKDDDPALVRVREYVHVDGGLVRVYPVGDPRGREVPPDGPYAVKAVLFPGSPARRGAEASNFYDIAFRVTEDGKAVSKSRRQVYGVAYDAAEPLASWVFAEVHLGEVACIPLAPEPPLMPNEPPR